MASGVARAKLARAAQALNAGAPFPAVILMTDEQRLPDPVLAARALPKGAAVILRHTDAAVRAVVARKLSHVVRERNLLLLIAGDAALAARAGAHGLHLPEARLKEAGHWKALRPSWLITTAAHSMRALAAAKRAGADAALLAPVFPTLSHVSRPALGAARFRQMAGQTPLPVYALGGINAQTVRRLSGTRLAGIAAIEGLSPD